MANKGVAQQTSRPLHGKIRLGKAPEDKLITRDVALVMAATFFFMASNMLVTPLVAGFAQSLGAGGALMGLVSGMMSIVSLFCRPIAGALSDKTSKRVLVGVGAALYLIANVWYACSSSPASLIAARMVNGVGFACCSVCLATWMSLLLPLRHMGAGMGLYGTMNALAMAVGPSIGIGVHQAVGYRPAFGVSIAMAVAMVCSVMLVRNGGNPYRAGQSDNSGKAAGSSKASGSGVRSTWSIRNIIEPKVIPLSLIFMLFAIPYFANQSFIASFAAGLHLRVHVSLFFPMYAIILLIMRLTLRNLFDSKPFTFWLVIGTFGMALTLVFLQYMVHDVMLLLAAFMMAASYGLMSSATQSQAVIIAGKARSGVANSTYYIGIDLGMSLGPLMGGFLYAHVSLHWFYLAFLLTLPLMWLIYALSHTYTQSAR